MRGFLLLILALLVAVGLALSGIPALVMLGAILILLAGINFLLGGARGGWKTLSICLLAVPLLWAEGHPIFFWGAILVVILNSWSFGVMYKFRAIPELAPNFWADVNLVTAIVGLALFIYGVTTNMEWSHPGP